MADLKNGDCVFFQEFQTGAHRKSTRIKVKNLAFGVLLGAIPPFGKDPSPAQLYRCMGEIGYLSFDDVAEFLGAELGQKCVEAFEKKYYTPVNPQVVPPPLNQEGVADLLESVGEAEPSKLVDAHGGQLKKDE